jgi:phospholipid/cholesterol/gamma-HCH transport system ATP-binding protein
MMIMYDEPFSGQDPISMGVIVSLIKRLNDAVDLTSLVVSHDVPETASIADRIFVISEGQVIEQGTPDALMRSKKAWTHQFMHGESDGPVPFHLPAPSLASDFLGHGE